MTQNPEPAKADAPYLEALLGDIQDSYAQALMLIDNSLKADFERQPAQALAFQNQIETHLAEGQRRLSLLRAQMGPWNAARRSQYPPELVERVDKFIQLLATGLAAVQNRLVQQNQAIAQRREEIRKALQELNKQRTGLHGYKHKGPRSKLFKDQA